MKSVDEARRAQRSAAFDALLMFNLFLILLQVWFCFGVVENLIAGKPAMAWPAAVGSVICFAINIWMYIGVLRMEKSGL